MRSAFAIAAFAAGALAVPSQDKRALANYAVQEDIVYETQIVTVTAYGPAPSSTAAAHYGHMSAAPVYQAPAPVSSAPAAVYQAPQSTQAAAAPSGYAGTVVYQHNLHRQNHTVPDLVWDDDMASSAQTIAASCVYAHNVDVNGGGYGQNIAAGVSSENIAQVITDMFYNGEEPLYTYYGSEPDMSNFDAWGHFSQIVWKSTTSVGCATQYCPGGLANTGGGVSPYFTVCNYKGPGNYAGEYAANVLAPIGNPTVNAPEGY